MEEKQNIETGLSLSDLFSMIFHNLFLIVMITGFVTLVGCIYTFKVIKPTYQSKAVVMVQVDKTGSGGGSSTNDYDVTLTLRLIQTVAEFFEKDVVLNDVAEKDSVQSINRSITASEMRNNLRVSFNSNSLYVDLSYSSKDPEEARIVLDEIIAVAIEIANEEYPVLKNTIYRVDNPQTGKYASPNKVLNVIISFILGGVLGVVSALLLEIFKSTIRDKKEIEALLPGYQVIGIISEIPEKEEGDK